MTTRRQFLRILAFGGSATLVLACTSGAAATGLTAEPMGALVDVTARGMVINAGNQRRMLVLHEIGGSRWMPIWIGQFEADAIDRHLKQVPVATTLTHPLMLNLVTATGSQVREVRILDRDADTFYAAVLLDTPNGPRAVDARPSDAVALGLLAGAPLRLARQLLETFGSDSETEFVPRPGPVVAPAPASSARTMLESEAEYVQVDVDGVAVNMTDFHRMVILKHAPSSSSLIIWIGQFESAAIAMPLQGVPVARPMSRDLMLSLLAATGSRLREVRIDPLDAESFRAHVCLDLPSGTAMVTARPSDAIAMALRTGALVLVATSVMRPVTPSSDPPTA